MDEATFWSMVESAWRSVGGRVAQRKKLAQGKLSEEAADVLAESLGEVAASLRESLEELSADDLLAFDRILERKLYDIDRAEIQKHTDGSDDGFLYARGFIVIAGQDYYDAVNKKPEIAMMDLECEEMCYISRHIYSENFGEAPKSEISRESGSNKAGWKNAAG